MEERMSVLSSSPTAPVLRSPSVTLTSLYLLRFAYVLLGPVLLITIWPDVLQHVAWTPTLGPWYAIGDSLLAALSLLALLGLRYPLKMLPLLFFELTWKTIWLCSVALPMVRSHAPISDGMAQTIPDCLFGAVFLVLIPWRYVYATYLRERGDRWR
jgi:hypothetical protein